MIHKKINNLFNYYGIKDNNKDKLFFFRFLLDPRINFQKIEFMLDLFYKYINGEEKFTYYKNHTIIDNFIDKKYIIILFLFYYLILFYIFNLNNN